MAKSKAKANKDKALDAVQQDINKAYGEGSIMRLGGTVTLDVESISTGCLSLDMALGVGGVPKGRVVDVCCFKSCLSTGSVNQTKPNLKG